MYRSFFWLSALAFLGAPISWWFGEQGIYLDLAGREAVCIQAGVGFGVLGVFLRFLSAMDKKATKDAASRCQVCGKPPKPGFVLCPDCLRRRGGAG